MAKIIVKPNENIHEALRRFKKSCDKEGIINRMRNSARFEKPSEARKRREEERIKTIRKAQKNTGGRARN